MALRKGFPAKLSGVGADADDMRYNLAGLVVRNADGSPRSGLFSPVSSSLLASTATMNIAVAAFSGVAVRDGGVVLLANDGPTNVLLDAPPSSNSRLDVIYAKQNDASNTVTVPDANNTPIFGVLKGTAAAIPVRNPAGLPAGALELGTVLVPSTAVNTGSSGVVITPTFQYTAMNGGNVDFRTKADLDLWTDAISGQHAYVIADSIEYVRLGGAWMPWNSDVFTYTPTITGITGGTRKFRWWWSGGEVVVSGQVSAILFSAITAAVTITIPWGALDPTLGTRFGSGILVDASVGEVYDVGVRSSGTTAVAVDRASVVGSNVKWGALSGTGAAGTNGAVLTVNFRFRPA